MKWFEYGNDRAGTVEVAASVASIVVGVGILTLPRLVAQTTESSDGWISIAAAGAVAIFLGWVMARYCGLLHDQGFYAFNAKLVSAPVSACFTTLIALYFILYTAYEVRAIANISKQYLFERTPVEFIALAFLLVVAYAVAGSREGILRLNLIFLPPVIVIAAAVLVFSIGIFNIHDLRPFFVTDWKGLAAGTKNSIFSLIGFESILFYSTMMKYPKAAPRAVAIGLSIPVMFYLLLYLVCVGVFTQPALMEITYPAVELAKEAQIPGEFFERFESLFFAIWIMTIFNTASMSFDVCVHALDSMMPRTGRIKWVIGISPVIYLVCMYPKNPGEVGKLGDLISYSGLTVAILVPILLYLYALMRGARAAA
ncbi:endospore germination permease [Paenibacillus sp. MWE-103]|uniref:Endospore germination permease n=1 Tax=Paenibacillus artemisiicola TaxID=1172618 RepID=A0ABS3WH31_9BACL|nr:endospore germination permease [Paenibacillus artemisiicola]MBO7747629.1 endospore germination permease [Paenibacillus artemisiicola]